MHHALHLTTLGLLLSVAVLPGEATARTRVPTPRSAQFAKVWDRKNFSHRLYDSLLRRHVKRGKIDYRALRKSSLPLLSEYLFRLAHTDPAKLSGGRKARLAFWINAHNALVVRTVLLRLPGKAGGRRSKTAAASSTPWKDYAYQVGGSWYTPRDILNRVLRPRFADPRVHFALVRPVFGGARMWPRAFTARKVSRWLSVVTRRYLRHGRRGFKLDRRTRKVLLPLLFKRYRKDFVVKPYKGVLSFVAHFLKNPADRDFLRRHLTHLTVRYRKPRPSPIRPK